MAAQEFAARQLRWSLLAGAAWFALVALAHTVGLKLPGLFIYFDLPSYAYQDRIIGFLAFGWSALFFTAAREAQAARPVIVAVLVAGLAALIGLARINAGTDFAGLTGAPRTGAYWLGCAAGLAYWIWLLWLFVRTKKPVQ